ncbi:MAG: ferritin [Thermoleophilia bacterium]|nr:ferritin [Thermoleophilia bacterium]
MTPDDTVRHALCTHMGREFSAHFQYLAMAAWFDDDGLPELAGFFARQAAEEHTHAMKFYRYVLDTGGPVSIQAQDAPTGAFTDAEAVVGAALAQETQITAWIDELVHLARDHRDTATEAFLQWFVTEQVEEVATMTELQQVVTRAGSANLLLVEDYIVRRRPGAPA